jgi:hypothetical protein
VVVVAAWEVLAAEEVALVLVLFVTEHSDSAEEDPDSEVGNSDFVEGNLDFAAEKGVLAVNVGPVVEFDFAMGALAVEFQVLELVGLVAVEDPGLVKEDPGSE